MNGKEGESVRATLEGPIFEFATQLIDNPEQLELYDQVKWNLLGHAQKELRYQGHHPRLERYDDRGGERAYTIPVFSGFSVDTRTAMIVRKDAWTHHLDPATWLVAEQHLETGVYTEPKVLSVSVDSARQMWLQIAPTNYSNWPKGFHPSLHAPRYAQIRVAGMLDKEYHGEHLEYRSGLYGPQIAYEDLEVLEMMIIAVQQQRRIAEEAHLKEVHERMIAQALGHIAENAA